MLAPDADGSSPCAPELVELLDGGEQAYPRMLRAIDSQTNFVMVNPMRPPDEVIEHLEKHNILIGPKYPVLAKYIRVSLGTPAEMQAFWRVWDLMPLSGKMVM